MAKESLKSEAKAEGETLAEEKAEHEKRARGGSAHPTHAGMRQASGGMELDTNGPLPGHPGDKKGGSAGHKRRRGGGRTDDDAPSDKVQEYNAQGSNEMKEAGDEKPGFKKGGEAHKKRRSGGMAMGDMEKPRLDRRPRRAAGGALHNPYSSASAFKDPSDDKAARGHEGADVKKSWS